MWGRKKSRSWKQCESIAKEIAESYVRMFFDEPGHRGSNFSKETPAKMAKVGAFTSFIDREWERFGDRIEETVYEHALAFYDEMEAEFGLEDNDDV